MSTIDTADISFYDSIFQISTINAVVGIVVLYGVYRVLQIGTRDPRMPPGPPTLPIIGNLHQIPTTQLYKKMKDWGEEFGGIYSLKLGPSNMIVLYDRRAVHDMVDKKSILYADRPHSYITDLVTQGDSLTFESRSPGQKLKRKLITNNLSPRMLDEKVAPVQEAEVTMFLSDILKTPEDFYTHMKRTTASIACIVTWGHRGKTYDDFWGHGVYDSLEKFGEALEPGANPPIDEFPFLKYIPERFAPWIRRARAAGEEMDYVWTKARSIVDERRARGDIRTSLVDKCLDEWAEKGTPPTFTKKVLDHTLGIVVEGAADTTSSSMLTLILCFALNPWVQVKAQRELDAVCGSDRMPEWTDFAKLPYINCIVKEGMRWHPVIPAGLLHRIGEDDWFDGMLIPKDSTIVIPSWALHHSERYGYKNPDDFNPDRYLNHPRLANDYAGSPDYMNRDHYGYGTGRRMCPGIHLAERNQWRIASKILWAFNIEVPIDPETGESIKLDPDNYVDGLLNCPAPFKVIFKPRSQAHINTINRGVVNAQNFLKPYE